MKRLSRCDMLTGSSPHHTEIISRAVRSYLNLEWQRKLDEEVSTSIPLVWAKEHIGKSADFGLHTMPSIVADVPSQSNGHDCGLFVLSCMDFWTHSPPDQVNLCQDGTLKGENLCFCYAHRFCSSDTCFMRQDTEVCVVCVLPA